MNESVRPSSHGPLTVTLHWLMAALFVAAFILGQIMEEMPRGDAKLSVLGWHLIAGAAIFALLIPRVLARLWNRTAHQMQGPLWERRAAHIVHVGLYALMIALPLTGLLTVATGRSTVPLWGDVQLVPLLTSKMLHEAMEETHGFLVGVLIAGIAAHIIGVLWHKYVRRDGIAGRMWPFRRRHMR